MRTIDWSKLSEASRSSALKRPPVSRSAELRSKTARILADVRKRGDVAVLQYTRRFDGVALKSLKVPPTEIRAAYRKVAAADLAAIKEAARRIALFHREQTPRPYSKEISKGIVCERRFVPVQKVGLYAPGGSAPLPSTVLMLGIPARIAGCPVRILATPPRKDLTIDPHILVAADLVGIKDIYKMGGAQAIAAMAYGTRTVPKTDKIFGPGNPWVTEAKIQVSGEAGGAACEFPAGPSEVLVIADAKADPAFVASDLLAQAEHGESSQVVLVSNSQALIAAVGPEIESQIQILPRASIIRAALSKSLIIRVRDLDEAFRVSNRYAPEHLILHIPQPRRWLPKIAHAGSVFLGSWSPEAAGDYASGPNHVLPTYGFAKAYGGVTVESFVKSMTVQELSRDGLRALGPVVERLASVECLQAHKESISLRLGRMAERA
jgi:histidinol dehydrogenase